MTELKAVFFDVDGVLLDTLPAHLQVCIDLATKYQLDLNIPNADDFRMNIVRAGTEIAPMPKFFDAVGFSGEDLMAASKWYVDNFSSFYRLPCFDGVHEMLRDLAPIVNLGIVTSNNLKNIQQPLAQSFELFQNNCVFTDDSDLSKSDAILNGASNLDIQACNILFVGDQERDRDAARDAGASFLGVTYGWQYLPDDMGLDLAHDRSEILRYVVARSHANANKAN